MQRDRDTGPAPDRTPAAPAENPSPTPISAPAAPDLSPPQLVPEAEKGETGARNVLLHWVWAIELKQFDQAYALLGEGAKQRIGEREFAAQFDGFGTITVAVPEGQMEGAAGSLFYEVPINIIGTGTGNDGKPRRLSGTTVLRRVNDVPGATAQQLRWHLDTSELN